MTNTTLKLFSCSCEAEKKNALGGFFCASCLNRKGTNFKPQPTIYYTPKAVTETGCRRSRAADTQRAPAHKLTSIVPVVHVTVQVGWNTCFISLSSLLYRVFLNQSQRKQTGRGMTSALYSKSLFSWVKNKQGLQATSLNVDGSIFLQSVVL